MLYSRYLQQSDRPVSNANILERPATALTAVRVPRALRPAPRASRLQVTVSQSSDGPVVRIQGEATFERADALLEALLVATAQRPAFVALDLTELRFISGSAMGVLVTFRRGVMHWGGRVRLAGELQPVVHETLARTRLLDLFEGSALTAGA